MKPSDFKDSCGRWLTIGLFLETNGYKDQFAVFTAGEEDKMYKGRKMIALRKRYLEMEDLTEYKFAAKYLGGWQHWKALLESAPVRALIEEWREELEVKMRSAALEEIVKLSKTEKGYQAAKLLLDRGWETRKAGAPSKEEKEGHLRKDKAFQQAIAADHERIGLTVVKG